MAEIDELRGLRRFRQHEVEQQISCKREPRDSLERRQRAQPRKARRQRGPRKQREREHEQDEQTELRAVLVAAEERVWKVEKPLAERRIEVRIEWCVSSLLARADEPEHHTGEDR